MSILADATVSPWAKRWLPICLAVMLGVPWVWLTQRFVALVLLLPAFLLLLSLHRHQRKMLTVSLWFLIAIAPLLPVDVSAINVPGQPRWVPLQMGKPSSEGIKAAARGEIVLGGCLVNGFEPRWVWVW